MMIALVHERGLAKPEYDARAIALGRELDARRKERWFWLSTQEQVAIARMGKALMRGRARWSPASGSVGDERSDVANVPMTGRTRRRRRARPALRARPRRRRTT